MPSASLLIALLYNAPCRHIPLRPYAPVDIGILHAAFFIGMYHPPVACVNRDMSDSVRLLPAPEKQQIPDSQFTLRYLNSLFRLLARNARKIDIRRLREYRLHKGRAVERFGLSVFGSVYVRRPNELFRSQHDSKSYLIGFGQESEHADQFGIRQQLLQGPFDEPIPRPGDRHAIVSRVHSRKFGLGSAEEQQIPRSEFRTRPSGHVSQLRRRQAASLSVKLRQRRGKPNM